MEFNPQQTYIHLGSGGTATRLPGGEAFWALPESDLERYGQSWLISEFETTSDWLNWEMHPNGDEFVYLLTGAIDMLLEQEKGTRILEIRGSGAMVVPRGVWHTTKVHAPSRMLHVTLGSGTQHRPHCTR
jgi:mannose-6-phosphate isomerase-like protein (cupin superfamily)